MIDEDLRETLQRRAETVAPSTTAGWTAVTRRIERRQRRTRTATLSLVGGFAFAAVAVAVVLVTNAIPDTDQNLAATGGSAPAYRPTTTYVTTTTLLGALDPVTGEPFPSEPGAALPSGPTTIVSSAATGPVDPGLTVTAAHTGGVYPETGAELVNTQAQVDEGHQPWWIDPAMVAASYLGNRGLTTTDEGAPRSLGEAGVLRYTAGGVGGWITVAKLAGGSIYFVEGSRTDRIVQLRVVRQGDRLAVDLIAASGGKVVVRTKRPGADWNPATSQVVTAGKPASLTVEGGAGADLIVQVRHEGDDGKVGLSDHRMYGAMSAFEYDGLRDGSVLGPSSLGPVRLGMSLTEAERVSGVAITTDVGESCTRLAPAGSPQGVDFVSTGGEDRVDVITVAAPGVRTAAGVGVGSTVSEVRSAYPDLDERITLDGDGRLIYAPEGDFVMVFGMVDGRVATIWSGADSLADTDEICA